MGSPYVQQGPFINNAPPAISAAVLNALETFLLSLNSSTYDTNITSDQLGNLTIPNTAHYQIAGFQIMWSPSSQDLILNAPNSGGSHKVVFEVGGTIVATIDSSGNMVLKGTLTQSGSPSL